MKRRRILLLAGALVVGLLLILAVGISLQPGAALMEFEFTALIHRPVEEVFAFFRDVDVHAAGSRNLVPVLDKLTPGPVGVGTRYREVVRILPFVNGEILTEVVAFEPNRLLDCRFVAMGMPGELTYLFEPLEEATRVVQRESLRPSGWMRPFSPLIGAMFSRMVGKRLAGIQAYLDSGALAQTEVKP